jgi:4-amino-4-deoxy-L-arabinose transferase-like glycosyltransferase
VIRFGGSGPSRSLVAILIVAAAARFVFGAYVVGFDAMTKGDEADYHAIATHLSETGQFAADDGHPTGRRPPAYPLFLAALYRVVGPDPVAGRVAQIVLGVVLVALTGLVARRLFDPVTGVVAAALAALNPFLIFISGYLLTENLYVVLMLGALCIAPSPDDIARGSWKRTATVGGLLALASLTRPTGLPVFEWGVAALVVLAAVPRRVRAVRAVVMIVAFAAIVTPWYARNARVMGGWVLTTHGGITFYQGNNPRMAMTPEWHGGAAPLGVLPRFDELAAMSEIDRDRLSWTLGREYLEHHPMQIPNLVIWKLARFWRLKSDMGLSGIRSGWWFNRNSALGRIAADVDLGLLYALVVIPLFGVGLFVSRRRWRPLALLYGVIVAHTAVAIVFFGSLRGRIPVEPVICVFAAVALVAAARAIRPRPAALPGR